MGNQTAGNKVVEILKEWGVSHLYGMSGDSINELCVIFNNEKIGMIEYEQQQMGHLDTETDISGINFAEFAKACGGEGYRVSSKTELHEAMQKAVHAARPVVIDCVVDMQPPLPGRISYQQAVHYSEFIIKNMFERGELSLPPLKKGWKRIKK